MAQEARDLASGSERRWTVAVIVLVGFFEFLGYQLAGFPAAGSSKEAKLVSEVLAQADTYRELVAERREVMQALRGAGGIADDARIAQLERKLAMARRALARRADALAAQVRNGRDGSGGVPREAPRAIVEAWTACVESAGADAGACEPLLRQGLGSDPSR